jgi:protein-disulfide isomerase
MRAFMALAILASTMSYRSIDAQETQQVSPAGLSAILAQPLLEQRSAGANAVVVEYFDYNCGFCKRFAPTLASVMEADKRLAVVYKDWPILGAVSVYAAKAVLAAQWQGKYFVAHDALLKSGHLTSPAQVDALLERTGVAMTQLRSDGVAHAAEISAVLVRNAREADALGLQGTPGIVVGRQLIDGITDASSLEGYIAASRRR